MDLRTVFDDLVRVEIALWAAGDARIRADHDAPLSYVEVLDVVHRRGACRGGAAPDDLRITVGGTSKIVDRMASQGLLVRTPNPDDRRSSLLTETETGGQLRRGAATSLRSVLEARVASVLSPRELRALASALAALRAA